MRLLLLCLLAACWSSPRRAAPEVIGVYGVTPLVFAADGTAAYTESGWISMSTTRVVPQACTAAHAPAYCAADGRYQVLREGDTLDVVFDAPAHVESQLVARGYYVPTPTRQRRAE